MLVGFTQKTTDKPRVAHEGKLAERTMFAPRSGLFSCSEQRGQQQREAGET